LRHRIVLDSQGIAVFVGKLCFCVLESEAHVFGARNDCTVKITKETSPITVNLAPTRVPNQTFSRHPFKDTHIHDTKQCDQLRKRRHFGVVGSRTRKKFRSAFSRWY